MSADLGDGLRARVAELEAEVADLRHDRQQALLLGLVLGLLLGLMIGAS